MRDRVMRPEAQRLELRSAPGASVVYELLLELGRRHEILGDIAALASKYAARLTPRLLRLTGGDRLPPAPIFLVPPGGE